MIVPEPVLAALSELFAENLDRDLTALVSVRGGFKIGEYSWALQLTTLQNETWYFRSIASNGCDLSALPLADPQQADTWSQNPRLSEQAQVWMTETLISMGHPNAAPSLCVVECQRMGPVLAVFCEDLDLVATTLRSWGNPPEPVVRDWKRQLDSHRRSAGRLCTAETLVTENGTLVPLFEITQRLETDSSEISVAENRQSSHSLAFLTPVPPWPDGIGSAKRVEPIAKQSTERQASQSIFHANFTAPVGSRSISVAPRKSSHRKWIATGLAGSCVVAAAVWWLNPHDRQVATTTKPPVQSNQAAKPSERNVGLKEDNSGIKATAPDDSEIVLTLEPGPTLTGSGSTNTELTLERLLAELSPNKTAPIRLDSLNASAIIAEVLSPQGADTPVMTSFSTNEDLGETDEKTAEADIKATVSDGGVITLERPIELRAAVSKETIAVGKFVLAKACRCEVTVKAASELVVEPMGQVAIEGTGKASWKIAIEDEEPELLLEVASKPGARWQIVVSVGLRETRNSPPILIGPRQAQNVGNRLIEYRHWLKSSIETLRTARTNNRGRSDFDFTGEIKKLERQDKEAEKAIERWKVVARLSHYFFDSNEVRLQLTAVAKQ